MTDERRSELSDLLRKLSDRTANPADADRLNELMTGDVDCCEFYLSHVELEAALEREFTAPPASPTLARAPRRLRRLIAAAAALALAASLALAFVAGVFWPGWPEPNIAKQAIGEPLATLSAVEGQAKVGDEIAEAGRQIRANERVTTIGPDSSAELLYPEGTRLLMAGDTELRLTDSGLGPQVAVRAGSLSADVRPQSPGRPLRILTGEAEVEVLGTKLTISRRAGCTQVGVHEGKVKLTREADRRSAEVLEGQRATVAAYAVLQPNRMDRPPDLYSLSLAVGLPDGWMTGQFVRDEGPGGTSGAVRAVLFEGPVHGPNYQVRSHGDFVSGLATVHPNSMVEVRYRTAKPGPVWVNLLFGDFDPTRRQNWGTTGQLPDAEPGADRWRLARMPVADCVGYQKPVGPLPARLCRFVLISGSTDIGLEVERFGLSRP